MKVIIVFLNLPWSFIGFIFGLLSVPRRVTISKNPPALVLYIKSFWWYWWFPGKRGVRAIAHGHTVLMSKYTDEKDLVHELIHVQQNIRWPLIFPLLYFIEMIKHGNGKANKYEKEAYEKSRSRYGDFVSPYRKKHN